MGTRRHGQVPPHGNVVKFFCALVTIVKGSVDKLFMHYFHNLSSDSAGFAPDPHRGSMLDSAGGLSSPGPSLPTPGNILRVPVDSPAYYCHLLMVSCFYSKTSFSAFICKINWQLWPQESRKS